MQQIGETVDAIVEDTDKLIKDIINTNQKRRDKYWIVLFAKPSRIRHNGLPTLMKVIKLYPQKPPSMVGMCIAEVDNTKGSIDWEVNMPDVPLDIGKMEYMGKGDKTVVETETIAGSYFK